jgi:transcriptional regulator with XRE-family HTH domain
MPAKELSPEQKADAARLKMAFKSWQTARKTLGLPFAQDEIAEEMFGFGQSALSQYLNGLIPLNATALLKFCKALRVSPDLISPSIAENARAAAREWTPPPKTSKRRA